MNVLDDILNAGGNVKYQEDYGFTESFFTSASTIIDDITKKKLIKKKITAMPNNYEQQLNHTICEKI